MLYYFGEKSDIMSKSYWDNSRRKRDEGPKFNFFIIFLIIIFTFILCLGTYLVIQNWDEIKGTSEASSETTTPFVETTTVTTLPAETTVTTTEATTTLANPIPQSAPVDPSYFENCVFIGDSISAGFSSYGFIPEKNVYASIGMNIDKINTQTMPVMLKDSVDATTYSIQEMTVIDALKISRPDTIYIMLGSNGIAWLSNDYMISKYQEFVDAIKAELPDTTIYIMSIPPVTVNREAEDNPNGQILNSNIDVYNSELLKFANDNGFYFIDVNTCLKGNDGKLPTEWAGRDGMHFNRDTYNLVINYILSHTVKEE